MRLAHARQGLNNAVAYLRNEIQVKNVIASETDRTISWVGRTTGILKGSITLSNINFCLIVSSTQYCYQMDRFSVLLPI